MTMKLKIDARNGIIEIEADETSFSLAAEEAKTLISALSNWTPTETPSTPDDDGNGAAPSSTSDDGEGAPADATKKRKRGRGSAKVASWKVVANLLDEPQRGVLREFFAAKAPANQNEQVAVLCAKLKELLNRDSFDGHEIHTAFQTVGIKTPGNLTAVLGNLATDGFGKTTEGKFEMNFKGDDLVKHDLPRKKKDK